MATNNAMRVQAAREILRRRSARDSLVAYSRAMTIPGAPLVAGDDDADHQRPIETGIARHHVVIMQAIERCIREPDGRLMIFAPPGSAKSTYASVVGTTWAMGRFPGLRVLATSYASAPIIRASKRARQIVQSREYATLWPDARLRGDSAAADEWELTNGSGLLACGLLGGITSSRADLAIIDDPVAGREEADSATMRAKTLAAYEDDFLTRIKPGASIILIQTRWHEDDLAGSILPQDYDGRSGRIACRDGQTWDVLSIQAKCERHDDPVGRQLGEYLWPEWFSAKHWANFEVNPRTWSALFQQRPAPEEGTEFRRGDFLRFRPGQEPRNLNVYIASDFATVSGGGDYTEHGVWGVDETGDLWAIGWFSGQVDTDVSIDAALDLCAEHRPRMWIGEAGVIERAIGPAIKRRMRERDIYVMRSLPPSVADKSMRAASFAARVQAGRVHIPETPWGEALIAQLCAFPGGRHDDKVDVCGLIGRALGELSEARPPSIERPAPKSGTFDWLIQSTKEPEYESVRTF